MKAYAGIGSRETPPEILSSMEGIAYWLAGKGWTLRSGRALGADTAFERGCDYSYGEKEVFEAKDCTVAAYALAEAFHPAWSKCSGFAKRLHGRNMMIISGQHLNQEVQMVICWTKDGKASGGTGQALRFAEYLGIPIFNLYFPTMREAISAQVRVGV
jgi:hypothetical protein